MSEPQRRFEEKTRPGGGRNRLLLAVAVIILLAGVIGAGFRWYPRGGKGAPTASPMRSVVEFSGTADDTTDTFQVREGWQIHWQTTGEAFSFAITGDRDYGTVVRQEGPGTGITSPVGAGTFRLKVTAKGPWSLWIVQQQQ